jgi:hypothetical protein
VALKQAQEQVIEKCQVVQQEKDDLQVNFAEDRAKIQQEKEQLLAEKVGVKEEFNIAVLSMIILEQIEEDPVEIQVVKLVATI